MSEDPFPRERVTAMIRRMPAYLKLAWRLAKDPVLSKARRAAVVGAAGYLASPVDLVPGVIPVIGQLDDLAVALAALKIALSGLDPERRRVHLASVGLADDDLAADLRTVGATTAWIGRAGYRSTKRVVSASGRVVTERAMPAARAAGSKAAPAARAVADKAAPVTRAAAPAVKAVGSKAAPAARAVADKAGPAVKATGRAAMGATTKAKGAASAAMRRLPGRGEPTVTVRPADVPLLPPPPPDRTTR